MEKKKQSKDVQDILTQEEIDALMSAADEPKKEQTAEDLAFEEEMKKGDGRRRKRAGKRQARQNLPFG